MRTDDLIQIAPYPAHLKALVENCTYRKGWTVKLHDDYPRDFRPDDHDRIDPIGKGMTLVITTATVNSYRQDEYVKVAHLFIVPAATYSYESWRRWLFEQFAKVELHECMEFFTIDGEKPFAPHHGPGQDPYTVFEHGSKAEVRTSYRGTVNE